MEYPEVDDFCPECGRLFCICTEEEIHGDIGTCMVDGAYGIVGQIHFRCGELFY